MALSYTTDLFEQVGRQRWRYVTIAFDSSYPTGGEAIAPAAKFGLQKVNMVITQPKSGYTFEYDYTNDKLLVYWGDNNNASDGPSVEVANTTNLSTLTGVKAIVIGF